MLKIVNPATRSLLAKIPADRIINFLPVAELKRWVTKVRAN